MKVSSLFFVAGLAIAILSIAPANAAPGNAAGSCAGGCVSSFRSGDAPWVGCSFAALPNFSSTCRNVGNFKTYDECRTASNKLGNKRDTAYFYCSSLGFRS